MIRLIQTASPLGIVAGALAVYVLCAPAPLTAIVRLAADGTASQAAVPAEAWPICSSMGPSAESPNWATLDPDFAAGKQAIAAGNWNGALKVLTSAALRDDRNADIQNYVGYAHSRLQQLDAAILHYQQALALNPRHRGAHKHLGEAYLVEGNLAKAREELATLERICLIPCEEHDDLQRAMAEYNSLARR
jgi:tetratricopeptide (TPR) repeat protein